MRVAILMTMFAAPMTLTACDSGQKEAETEDTTMAEGMPAEDMLTTGPDAEMRMADAEGTVTVIDNDAGTITIDHGPVPAVDWPAMMMAFQADEAQRRQVAVGDEVEFAFRVSSGGSEITSITRK